MFLAGVISYGQQLEGSLFFMEIRASYRNQFREKDCKTALSRVTPSNAEGDTRDIEPFARFCSVFLTVVNCNKRCTFFALCFFRLCVLLFVSSISRLRRFRFVWVHIIQLSVFVSCFVLGSSLSYVESMFIV